VQKHSYRLELIEETRDFVLNVRTDRELHAIQKSIGMSGRDVEDRFAAQSLETLPAKHVKAPLVKGCHANVECRIRNRMDSETTVIFLAEALACHVDESLPPVARLGGKTFRLDGPID